MEKTQKKKPPLKQTTAFDILSLKKKRKISMLTAYDYPIARILDQSGIDIILVGDSLGDVALGYKNTLPVTQTEMIVHTQAVARAVQRSLIIADMPFGSFQQEKKHAVSSAIDLIKAGASGVKVEGANYIENIRAIINAGIPVMGHLGFTPQSVYQLGFKIQGKSHKQVRKLLLDAKKLERAGCFALVLELIPAKAAKTITRALKIPVIGIGAGPDCDGQVLVTHDILGLYPNPPAFVKKYADLGLVISRVVKEFILRL
jgi:3-methyl-2-oxobutanoate hydroxymethyltransferase